MNTQQRAEADVDYAKQAVDNARQDVYKAERKVESAETNVRSARQADSDVNTRTVETARQVNEAEHRWEEARIDFKEAYRRFDEARIDFKEAQRRLEEANRRLEEEKRRLDEAWKWVEKARSDFLSAPDEKKDMFQTQYLKATQHYQKKISQTSPNESSDILSPLINIATNPEKVTVLSTPSKNDEGSILKTGCIHVERNSCPLFVSVPNDFRNPIDDTLNEDLKGNLEVLLAEKNYYNVASTIVPEWIEQVGRKMEAKRNQGSLFPETSPMCRFVRFANFEPELYTRVTEICRPAYNGEIKSVGTQSIMFDQIANYVLFGIIDSFFRDDNSSTTHCFYVIPPVGYGLLELFSTHSCGMEVSNF